MSWADLGLIQAHRATHGRPYADQRAGQRRFTAGAGADNRKHFALVQAEIDAPQNRLRSTGRPDIQLFQAHRAGRRRQRHAWAIARVLAKELGQTLVAQASGIELFPGADGNFHGGQGTPQQQRHGDHHARRQLAFKHQQRAQTQGQ